jgi:hypothetical protein
MQKWRLVLRNEIQKYKGKYTIGSTVKLGARAAARCGTASNLKFEVLTNFPTFQTLFLKIVIKPVEVLMDSFKQISC